jgi:hypothetical protein
MRSATKRRCSMYSTSIAPESTKPPASLIRGSCRIIIAYRRRIWWNRSIVQENATRDNEYGNQGAKKARRSFGTRKQRAGTASVVRYAIEKGSVRGPCWCRVPILALPRGKGIPCAEIQTNTFRIGRPRRISFLLGHTFSIRSMCDREKKLSGSHASSPTMGRGFSTESRAIRTVSSASSRNLRSRQLDYRPFRASCPIGQTASSFS